MARLRLDSGPPESQPRSPAAAGSPLQPGPLLPSQQWVWPEARARQGGPGWPESGRVFPLQPWGRQARAEGIQKSGAFKVKEIHQSGGAAWLLAGMGTGELSPGVPGQVWTKDLLAVGDGPWASSCPAGPRREWSGPSVRSWAGDGGRQTAASDAKVAPSLHASHLTPLWSRCRAMTGSRPQGPAAGRLWRPRASQSSGRRVGGGWHLPLSLFPVPVLAHLLWGQGHPSWGGLAEC